MIGSSSISVLQFYRVVIWLLIELDIPQLSSDGVYFGNECFLWTYSIQLSSTHSLISSSFDAPGLENYFTYGNKSPSSTSHIVKNRTELDSIPLNVEDLWIQPFDTSELIEYSFNSFQSLQSLVIGNGAFMTETRFELSNLPSLRSIDIGHKSFKCTPSFSLTGLIDCIH